MLARTSSQQAWEILMPSSANSSEKISKLSPELRCLLTEQPLQQPVRSTKGYVYEKKALQDWFTQNNHEPTSGELLVPQDRRCVPFPILAQALQILQPSSNSSCSIEESPSKHKNPFTNVPKATLLEHLPTCPISWQPMVCPVVTEYFHTYELTSLHTWWQQTNKDPTANLICNNGVQYDEAVWQLIYCMRTAADLDPPPALPTKLEPWMESRMIEAGYRGYKVPNPHPNLTRGIPERP